MWDIVHKVFVEIGITFVSICHIRALVKEDWQYIRPITQFIRRRLGDRRIPMDTLNYLALISKIATEAPILLPDAMKILGDINQVNVDFQKLLADFQGIKAQAASTKS